MSLKYLWMGRRRKQNEQLKVSEQLQGQLPKHLQDNKKSIQNSRW